MRVCLAETNAHVPARLSNPDLGCKIVQIRFGWSCEAWTTFVYLRRLHLPLLFRGRFVLTAHPCPPFLGSLWVQQSPPRACLLCATLSENFGALLLLRQILVRRSSIVGTVSDSPFPPPWLRQCQDFAGADPLGGGGCLLRRGWCFNTKHDPPRRDPLLEGVYNTGIRAALACVLVNFALDWMNCCLRCLRSMIQLDAFW